MVRLILPTHRNLILFITICNAILSSSKRIHSVERWSDGIYFQVTHVTIAYTSHLRLYPLYPTFIKELAQSCKKFDNYSGLLALSASIGINLSLGERPEIACSVGARAVG